MLLAVLLPVHSVWILHLRFVYYPFYPACGSGLNGVKRCLCADGAADCYVLSVRRHEQGALRHDFGAHYYDFGARCVSLRCRLCSRCCP